MDKTSQTYCVCAYGRSGTHYSVTDNSLNGIAPCRHMSYILLMLDSPSIRKIHFVTYVRVCVPVCAGWQVEFLCPDILENLIYVCCSSSRFPSPPTPPVYRSNVSGRDRTGSPSLGSYNPFFYQLTYCMSKKEWLFQLPHHRHHIDLACQIKKDNVSQLII